VLDPVAGPTDGDEVVDVVVAALSTGFDVVGLERAVVLKAALAGVAVEFERFRTEVVPVVTVSVPVRVVRVGGSHESVTLDSGPRYLNLVNTGHELELAL
jgi:hypothetical protein